MGVYNGVYQLKRSPRAVPCSEKTLKECLQHRQGAAQPEKELRQRSMGTRTSRMPAQAEFCDHMQSTYDHYWERQQDSQEEALRVGRDAHHWVLVSATLLEGHIERLGHSITCGQSCSQEHSGSCQHSRSRSCTRSCRRCPPAIQGEQDASVANCTGDPAKRWAASPSPVRPQRWVTFEDSSPRRDTDVKQTPPPSTGGGQSLGALALSCSPGQRSLRTWGTLPN